MNGSVLWHHWTGSVESFSFLALVILALAVMVRAVPLGDAMRYLAAIVGAVILLVVLPQIIASAWSAMSFRQHLGVIAFGVLIVLLFRAIPSAKNRY